MIPVSVAPALVDYFLDFTWPALNVAAANAAAFDTNGNVRHGGPTVMPIWSDNWGAGPDGMVTLAETYCGCFQCDGLGAISGRAAHKIPFYIPLMAYGTVAPAFNPEIMKVSRVQFLMMHNWFAPIAFTGLTGVCMSLASAAGGGVPAWINNSGRGFGIVGNGAGNWQYVEKKAGGVGVYQYVQPLVWPGALNAWVLVDFEIIAASGLGDAILNVYLNGLPVVSRTWRAAGVSLPLYDDLANSAKWVFAAQAGEPALSTTLCLTGMRWMQGRYRVSGAQV